MRRVHGRRFYERASGNDVFGYFAVAAERLTMTGRAFVLTGLLGALPEHATEPSVRGAVTRYLTHVAEAIERLKQLNGTASPDGVNEAGVSRPR